MKAFVFGNGQGYTRTQDLDGRMTSYNLGSISRSVAYDSKSRISGFTHTASALDQTFSYDNLDRLAGWTAFGTGQQFSYDLNGNRTGVTIGASNYGDTISGTSNRLASTAGPTARSYAYDAAGTPAVTAVRSPMMSANGSSGPRTDRPPRTTRSTHSVSACGRVQGARRQSFTTTPVVE